MTEFKLVALDLDGTLLDDKKCLSQRNREALLECIRREIVIVATTGRPLVGIPNEIKQLPGVRYAITTNGATIVDMQKKEVLDSRCLSNELTLEILETLNHYEVMYDPYVEGRGISESRFMDHLDQYNLSAELQELVRATRDVVPDIREYMKKIGKPVEKINLFFKTKEERARLREELKQYSEIVVSSSMPHNLEINALEATKGQAVLRLAKHLGILQSQIMALGDGENDITMLQAAGFGIAMSNAEEILKVEADYITTSNIEDGVAAAIERFILEKR